MKGERFGEHREGRSWDLSLEARKGCQVAGEETEKPGERNEERRARAFATPPWAADLLREKLST